MKTRTNKNPGEIPLHKFKNSERWERTNSTYDQLSSYGVGSLLTYFLYDMNYEQLRYFWRVRVNFFYIRVYKKIGNIIVFRKNIATTRKNKSSSKFDKCIIFHENEYEQKINAALIL